MILAWASPFNEVASHNMDSVNFVYEKNISQ